MRLTRLMKFTISGMVLAFHLSEANAEPFAATPQETALCTAQVYGGIPVEQRRSGPGRDQWAHMHHYCDCVRFRYRALKYIQNKAEFKRLLGMGIGGCDYVLKRLAPGHFLTGQILVDKGRALKLLGDVSQAGQAFQSAIQFDRRYAVAYLELATLQKSMGQASTALDTLFSGLERSPGTKVLEETYREWGGQKELPTQAEPDDAPVSADETSANSDASPIQDDVTETPPADDGLAESSAEQVPAQGCRFCPPDEINQSWRESFGGN